MSSEPADGVRPVHAARCEWILSGARGKGGSPEYPTPLLSRYREMISSPEPADFPPGPKRIGICRDGKILLSESGWHRESIVPIRMIGFLFFGISSERSLKCRFQNSIAASEHISEMQKMQKSMFKEEKIMKMKKLLASAMASVLVLSALAGCGGGNSASSSGGSDGGSYKIGISQFAEHPSLDNCREGFLAGLEEEGIVEGENLEVLYDNAQSDTAVPTTIASSYISDRVLT